MGLSIAASAFRWDDTGTVTTQTPQRSGLTRELDRLPHRLSFRRSCPCCVLSSARTGSMPSTRCDYDVVCCADLLAPSG